MPRLFSWFSQVFAVTLLNLRTLRERLGSSAAAVVGVAGVVCVFVAVLSIAEGFRLAMIGAGSPDVAIVMRGGSDTEMMSILMREDARIVSDAPGIRRGPQGPLASGELYLLIDLPRIVTNTEANVPLRGVEPPAFAIREKIHTVEGRNFVFGKNELIAGVGAAREFRGAQLGSTLRLGETDWNVVGLFEAGGSITETEIWGDTNVLGDAYRRGRSYQAVFVKLDSPGAFDSFKAALMADPRLNVKVMRETDYYAEQSTMLYNLITGLGSLVAGLMGIGAVFGALNTMYSAVSARTREIATLRALGFGGSPVVISVLAEALLLALVGGALGSGFAWFAFDGFRAATMNWQTFSQVTFAFAVTPALLVQGTIYSLVMGFFGGLFPAIRAARLSVASALREL